MKTSTRDKSGRSTHRPTAFLLSMILAGGVAFGTYIPPDYYGDAHKGAVIIRKNMGQVFDTEGHLRPDIAAYLEGSPVNIYLRDSSRISYTFDVMHNDSATPDTSYRVDMAIGATKLEGPDLVVPAPGVANYYRGSSAVEQVPAYYRGIYADVLRNIDFHVYGSSGGPRMAFVVRPGGNPADIKLIFTGQDSIGIDWQGALKLYLNGKWVKLEQAVAYQMAGDGTLVPLGWTAHYTHQQGSVVAGFTFSSYDQNLPLVLQIGYGPLALGGTDDRDMDWSTYMGSGADDEFTCVETDEDGNAYTCGYTYSTDFPVHPGNAHYNSFDGDFAGHEDAVVVKFNGATKRVEWGTYYGGDTAVGLYPDEDEAPRTEARKLAPYTGSDTARQYIFVTGVTNCTDFDTLARVGSIFQDAMSEAYMGGRSRMWVGAFRKENGVRDWATTHGQTTGHTSVEEGTSIVVDAAGRVAVGGRLWNSVNNALTTPDFPLFTPSGAYAHTGGGGFVLAFNTDYTLRWATTIGSISHTGVYTGVNDLRYIKDGRFLWFTGINSGTTPALDLVPQPGGYNGTQGSVMLGEFNMVGVPVLDYCTRWGGGDDSPESIAYGLDFDGQDLWVVGGTRRSSLSATDAPLPPGSPSTVYHELVNASDQGTSPFVNPCDGFILKFDPFLYEPVYGTLIGGSKYDMLTDVGHDADNVYITGESRSPSGFAEDLNSLRYFQPMNPNDSTRDAVVLAIRAGLAPPELEWRTLFGGIKSERGWGIAGSTAEGSDVYLVGATASQATEAFPLHEFSTTSTLDYYQPINFYGPGGSSFLYPWSRFEYALDFEGDGELNLASTENSHQGQDAFIASFSAHHPVGIGELHGNDQELQVTPLPKEAHWTLRFPYSGNWTVEVYDAVGHKVAERKRVGTTLDLDLSKEASGMYLLRAVTGTGDVHSAKVIRK